jgi:dipeptidyl aminopeptidase/acylaminoacyl peptidase
MGLWHRKKWTLIVGLAVGMVTSVMGDKDNSHEILPKNLKEATSEHHLIPHKDNPSKKVEFFLKKPTGLGPYKTILMVHGHQQQPNNQGGKILAEDGTLERLTQEGYLAVALSQPGYGGSEGSPDWCGPYTQGALVTVLEYLKFQGLSQKDKVVLMGVSRGAVVAGIVLTQENQLAGAILESSFYDLANVVDPRTVTNLKKEAGLSEQHFKERSIAYKVATIKAPLLLLHGYHDPRAPVGSTLAFYQDLMAAKKDATLVLFPTGHHIPKEEKWVYMLRFLKNTLSNNSY